MKRILLCLMMATLMTLSSEAQTDKVYDRVEVMPEFPGGMQGLFEYMQNNVNYPKEDGDLEGSRFESDA